MKKSFEVFNISNKRWISAIVVVILSAVYSEYFTIIIAKLFNLPKNILLYLNMLVFAIAMIISSKIIDRRFIKKVFFKIKLSDIKYIVLSIVLTIFCSIALANIFEYFGIKIADNLVVGELKKSNSILFYIFSIFQLFAEEVIFAIPFFFVYSKLHNKGNKFATIVATAITCLIFGGLHLPAYEKNVIQSFVLIGITKWILSYGFLKTKNMNVAYISHLLYDWILFSIVLFFS